MAKVITIDGPSGAGKGTVARILAKHLGYALLDSGAIYRIAALAALQKNISFDNADALANLASKLHIEFITAAEETRVLLSGQDVSAAIREEKTGLAASQIAPHPAVREALLERQRDFAQEPGLIADGRDMGTVVFPNAERKFFLTASAYERARRRCLQLEQAGQAVDFDKILSDIEARDERDMNRSTAPMRPAEDAILIDSSSLTIEAVVETLLNHIRV